MDIKECILFSFTLATTVLLYMIYKYIFKTLKNIENRENNYKVNFCINIRDNGIQCKAIKKNGKQCKQMGKERQTGGIIINGYCTYHKHLR